jgi:hypothetical protein
MRHRCCERDHSQIAKTTMVTMVTDGHTMVTEWKALQTPAPTEDAHTESTCCDHCDRCDRQTASCTRDPLGPLDAHIDHFVARLRARLEAGAATYGDASFTRPAAELVDEVQQELEDVCGWSLLLWIRLERLKARVAELGAGETHGSV